MAGTQFACRSHQRAKAGGVQFGEMREPLAMRKQPLCGMVGAHSVEWKCQFAEWKLPNVFFDTVHSAEWARQFTEWGFSVLRIGCEPTKQASGPNQGESAGQCGNWAGRTLQNGIGFADGIARFVRFRLLCAGCGLSATQSWPQQAETDPGQVC
jgi:hypothetical protein